MPSLHWTTHVESFQRPAWDPSLPVVSIITPNYNYGHFLETCIRSILLQTYPNIEYIIIDAGSTDNTLDLIEKYEKHGITQWVSEKDKGQTDAINKGFAMTTGHLFAWLNSDDSYAHDRVIETVVDHYQKGAKFISAEWNAVDEHGHPHPPGQPYGDIDPVTFRECIRFWEHTCPTQPATFVDRALAANVFPLDISVECFMDFQLFLGVLAQEPKAAWIKERWVNFIFHGANKSLGNYTDAYDSSQETRTVFMGAAAQYLPPEELNAFRKEFEPMLIIRTAPRISWGKLFSRTFKNAPSLFVQIRFWKAVARKLVNTIKRQSPKNPAAN